MTQRALVTGCAGFIGSHLAERLVDDGVQVVGVDSFTDFYPRAVKERNLARLRDEPLFELRELDLGFRRVAGLLEGVDVVYHLAGQPGVRQSFGGRFKLYLRNNVHATQRLLEAAAHDPVDAFVYASSSSVYGDAPSYPTPEDSPLAPVSPYAMSKTATEEIANVYLRTREIPVVGLRYFTVYGPRQRPDMAFARFIDAALDGRPLPVLGDGRQLREFTYVADAVDATVAAARHGRHGLAYNVGGGSSIVLRDVIALLERLVGRPLARVHDRAPRGDVRETRADGALSRRDLGFRPRTPLEEGLLAQLDAVRLHHPTTTAA